MWEIKVNSGTWLNYCKAALIIQNCFSSTAFHLISYLDNLPSLQFSQCMSHYFYYQHRNPTSSWVWQIVQRTCSFAFSQRPLPNPHKALVQCIYTLWLWQNRLMVSYRLISRCECLWSLFLLCCTWWPFFSSFSTECRKTAWQQAM